MKTWIFIAIAFVVFCMVASETSKRAPVIGILTTPSDIDGYDPGEYSYITSTYVEYMEAAGAQVVPIPYDASYDNITYLLDRVNGVLLPGGNAKLNETDKDGNIGPSNVTAAAAFVINYAVKKNRDGTHYPILALCQGYEIMVMAMSNNYDILDNGYEDKDLRAPVEFTDDAGKSKLWGGMPEILSRQVSQNDIFFVNLEFAIPPWKLEMCGALQSHFKVLTITQPLKGGDEYVSSIEGRDLPFYGIAFHPEKNGYLHRQDVNATHTKEAILASAQFSQIFVEDAKKNSHKFESDKALERSLVNNWMVVYPDEMFDEAYMFHTVNKTTWIYPNLYENH